MSYDYMYDYNAVDTAAKGVFGIFKGVMIFGLLFGIFMIVCMWKLFKKAGKQGWESIVPIYNIIVLFQISGLPTWYIILMFIPIANLYAVIKLYIELAKKFGKDTTFGVLMLFFPYICIPILAFGDNQYNGEKIVNAVPSAENAPVQNQVGTVQPTEPINNIQVAPTETTNGFNVTPNNFSGTVEGMGNNYDPQMQSTPVDPVPTPVAPVESTVDPVPTAPVAPSVASAPVENVPEATVPANKFCPNCGQSLEADVVFCPNCGTKC